jgi:TctA family transporter
MLIGNVMLVIINLPLIGLWVQLLRVPYRILFPVILTICCIGAYSLEFSAVDLMALSAFAGAGVLLVAFGFPPVPLLLGYILGPLAEENLRRAMAISGGDATVFVTRPISLTIMLLIVALIAVVTLPTFRRNREVFDEQ